MIQIVQQSIRLGVQYNLLNPHRNKKKLREDLKDLINTKCLNKLKIKYLNSYPKLKTFNQQNNQLGLNLKIIRKISIASKISVLLIKMI